jgi:hypothetical protein
MSRILTKYVLKLLLIADVNEIDALLLAGCVESRTSLLGKL